MYKLYTFFRDSSWLVIQNTYVNQLNSEIVQNPFPARWLSPVTWPAGPLRQAESGTVTVVPLGTGQTVREVLRPDARKVISRGTRLLVPASRDAVVAGTALVPYDKQNFNNFDYRTTFTYWSYSSIIIRTNLHSYTKSIKSLVWLYTV